MGKVKYFYETVTTDYEFNAIRNVTVLAINIHLNSTTATKAFEDFKVKPVSQELIV